MLSLIRSLARSTIVLAAATLGLGAPSAGAQTASALAEKEITREAIDLQQLVRPVPVDRDRVDSVLVFNNTGRPTGMVYCVAWDGQGQAVGRFRVKVPGKGLRYVLASDAAGGRDFVGSVQCTSPRLLIGSAFLLAPPLTPLPAVQSESDGLVRLRFPVVATY